MDGQHGGELNGWSTWWRVKWMVNMVEISLMYVICNC